MMRSERKDELVKDDPKNANNTVALVKKMLAEYLRVTDLGWARTIVVATVLDVMAIRIKYDVEKIPSKQSSLELEIVNVIESQLRVGLEIKNKVRTPNELIDELVDEIRRQRNRLSNPEGRLSEILSVTETILIAQKEILYRFSVQEKNFLASSLSQLVSNELDEVIKNIKQQEKKSKLTRGIIAIKSFFGIQHKGALEREFEHVKTEIHTIKRNLI